MTFSRSSIQRVADATIGQNSLPRLHPQVASLPVTRAFTLVEIAICLGIIGFALVAIIGILPAGLQVQRDNKEDTIINQEATYLIEAIRNGAEELEDLLYRVDGIVIENIDKTGTPMVFTNTDFAWPREIIGLLSTPAELGPDTNRAQQVRAFVRAGSGSAAESGTNELVRDLAFRYEVTIRNFAFTNSNPDLAQDMRDELARQLRDVRLDFRWPLTSRGTGGGRQIFRTQLNGTLVSTRTNVGGDNVDLYFCRQ